MKIGNRSTTVSDVAVLNVSFSLLQMKNFWYHKKFTSLFAAWLDRYSAPLIQHEWVLECIGKYCVTSFAPTLLCDTSDDVLISMRIPSYLFESIDSEKSE